MISNDDILTYCYFNLKYTSWNILLDVSKKQCFSVKKPLSFEMYVTCTKYCSRKRMHAIFQFLAVCTLSVLSTLWVKKAHQILTDSQNSFIDTLSGKFIVQ